MKKQLDNSLRATVLNNARASVLGDRHLNYGSPEENFTRIARLWNAYLINAGIVSPIDASRQITEPDVALLMVLLKTARLEHTPAHLDSWIDIAGYAACGAEVAKDGK